MLGTFSFEPYFKSYLCFTVWSPEISEISFGSFSPSSSSFPLFSPPPLCRAPPARRGEPPPRATSCLLAHASLRSFPTALAIALCPSLLCHAPPPSPEPPARPPPRRRGGELAAEPAAHSSRTHEHDKNPSDPFPSLFRSFLASTPQNTAAAPPRTPASSPSPSTRHSRAAPPALTP